MTRQYLLDSICRYRELYNSIEANIDLTSEEIIEKYFGFEYSRSTTGNLINSEHLVIRNRKAFEELPSELKHYYESLS